MTLYKDYISNKNQNFYHIELSYSLFYFISSNPRWFCRIWRKDWVKKTYLKSFGNSYGKTKFEAYRKALIDLNK